MALHLDKETVMNTAEISTDMPAITLWVLNRDGNEIRCVVDAASGRVNPFTRGTARLLVDGFVVDRQMFADLDELVELTADWGSRITPLIG
jgi:hypothetical protein